MNEVSDPAKEIGVALSDLSVKLATMQGGSAIIDRLSAAGDSPTPAAAGECAGLLIRLGFVSQAEILFKALARLFPAMPMGRAGLVQIAVQRKNWKRALARWSELSAAFPKQVNSAWQSTRATILDEMGCRQEAEAILQRLVDEFPHEPAGFAALAQRAGGTQDWKQALDRWNDVLERFPQHPSLPFWKLSRAHALTELGLHQEAEPIYRDLLQADPWIIGALHGVLRILMEAGKAENALAELDASIIAGAVVPNMLFRKINILARLMRVDEARSEFARHVQCASGIEAIEGLLTEAPLLHEDWKLTEITRDLLERMDDFPAPSDPADGQYRETLRAQIKLALGDRSGFLASVGGIDLDEFGEKGKTLRRVAAAIADPHFPNYEKPKIFGIGLSKTGTTSLASALQALGLNSSHWTNPLTCRILSDADVHLFDALSDTPICVSFEKYYHLYPNAKFILTTRPIDSWIRSMTGFLQRSHGTADLEQLRQRMVQPGYFRYGSIFREIYFSLYLNHADLRQAYEAYDRRVRRFFSDKPTDKFLELDLFAGQGWQELCDFVGKEIPALDFPFENRGPAGVLAARQRNTPDPTPKR